jgi:FkbM family methyltransferase
MPRSSVPLVKSGGILSAEINILAKLLGNERVSAIDAGARGGMQRHWLDFSSVIELDAFEPDEIACKAQMDAGRKNERWYPIALGAATGPGKLYVVNKASSSSVFPPNEIESARYDFAGAREVAKVADIHLVALSDFLTEYKRPRPNLVKLDTQGSELAILSGLKPEDWSELLAVQAEVTFIERYKGEPMFRDVDALMRARGFIMFDLLQVRKYRTAGRRRHYFLRKYLGISRNRRDISCRTVAGDALYFRPTEEILESGDRHRILKMLVILLAYRCLDEGLWLIEEAGKRAIFPPEETRRLIDVVRARAPRAHIWQRTGALANLSRAVLRQLGISRRKVAEYWLDRSWDH